MGRLAILLTGFASRAAPAARRLTLRQFDRRRILGGLLLTGVALIACEKQPATIKVKMPRDAIQSVKMDPVVPPFEHKNDTIQLRASAFDKDGAFMGPAKVSWSSSDPSVAVINTDGLVTIVSSGKAEIKASGVGYEKPLDGTLALRASIIDKVKIVPPEGGVPPKIHLGETMQFKAEVLDDRGNVIPDAKVKWRTSDYAATVTMTGELEGRAIGDTQLILEAGPKLARMDILVLDWKKGAKQRDD
jgi:hypothetical protein